MPKILISSLICSLLLASTSLLASELSVEDLFQNSHNSEAFEQAISEQYPDLMMGEGDNQRVNYLKLIVKARSEFQKDLAGLKEANQRLDRLFEDPIGYTASN